MAKKGVDPELVTGFKQSFIEYYLPPVCQPGKQCRIDIRTKAKADIAVEWENGLKEIQTVIENLFTISKTKMTVAYNEAWECEHGCSCQYIETQYAYIKSQISKIEEEIVTLEDRIKVVQGNIDGVHENCDFSALEAEWQTTSSELQTQYESELAAVKGWREDAYEIENAVDQEQFAKDNGFEYSSELFDKVYEGEDQV